MINCDMLQNTFGKICSNIIYIFISVRNKPSEDTLTVCFVALFMALPLRRDSDEEDDTYEADGYKKERCDKSSLIARD